MKFYGKAEDAAAQIVKAFENPEALPSRMAPMFFQIPGGGFVPHCKKWSWGNRFLVALFGFRDARGFRQWEEAGRKVKKGEKALAILAPLSKKIGGEDGEDERFITYGFRHVSVFGYEQTEGEPLPGMAEQDAELDRLQREFIGSLPLLDVAEAWDLGVSAKAGPQAALGYYAPSRREIGLYVENLSTWAHELCHAADERALGRPLRPGQDPDQEIVAELGGAVLLTLLGETPQADLGGCWDYVSGYAAKGGNAHAVTACQRLLGRVCAAVSLIMETAEARASVESEELACV